MESCFNGLFSSSSLCCATVPCSKQVNQQIKNSPHDPLFAQRDVDDVSHTQTFELFEGDGGSVEEFNTAPTSPLTKPNDTQFPAHSVITQQPAQNYRKYHVDIDSPYYDNNIAEERISKRKKTIFHPENVANKSLLCCHVADDIRPDQVDMCPTSWYRNCCTWQDLIDDANLSKPHTLALQSVTSAIIPQIKNRTPPEEVNVRKSIAASRICWRACFVTICLPACYPCYLSRTIRRSCRQGDVSRREAVLQKCKREGLKETSNYSMNNTLLKQVSEVKLKCKGTLEHSSNNKNNHNLHSVIKDNNGDDANSSKVINVNVIVLKSKSSQVLHNHLSKKYDSHENSASTLLLPDNPLLETASAQTRGQGSSLNKPATLLTQAIINTSSQASKPPRRYSNPTISVSSASKFEPSLSVVHEKSTVDTDSICTQSGLNSDLLQNKTPTNGNTTPSISVIQATNPTAPVDKESRTLIRPISQIDEDVKSIKSEVFFDAEENLPLEIPEEDQEAQLLRRRCGRDESNSMSTFVGKTLNKNKNDESDSVSKKRNVHRNVSFSRASRRWSRLISVTKSTSRFSGVVRKESLNDNNDDIGLEVELRKVSSKGREKMKKFSAVSTSSYYSFDSDSDEGSTNDEMPKERQKVVEMKFSGNRIELVDDVGSLSFSIFDGASVSEWKGRDLKLANRIPNIDLLVLGIEENNVEEIQSVLDLHYGIMSYIARFWRGFYPLLLIELTTDEEVEEKEKKLYQSKFDQLHHLFGDVHHIQLKKSALEQDTYSHRFQSTLDWINECLARLFVHSRLYQCSRFYGKRINLEDICPGGCELRKWRRRGGIITRQKAKRRFKSAYKKASIIRALSATEAQQEQEVPTSKLSSTIVTEQS